MGFDLRILFCVAINLRCEGQLSLGCANAVVAERKTKQNLLFTFGQVLGCLNFWIKTIQLSPRGRGCVQFGYNGKNKTSHTPKLNNLTDLKGMRADRANVYYVDESYRNAALLNAGDLHWE